MPRMRKNNLSWLKRLNLGGGGRRRSSKSWQRAFDYLPDLDDSLDSYLTQFGSQNFDDSGIIYYYYYYIKWYLIFIVY